MSPSLPIKEFLPRLLLHCLDIRAIWSLGHGAGEDEVAPACQLLAFADLATLQRLRKCDSLHGLGIDLFVVLDGDLFENAWGRRVSGSLGRWAWREVTPQLAYYDESRWAARSDEGNVVRVRKRALLVWRSVEAEAIA
ncbi:MAG TPA: hypothetical protein VM183_06520 [Burkholderiales bacterium]|nr:hypothetical protein [Burkholderiales bacterium]